MSPSSCHPSSLYLGITLFVDSKKHIKDRDEFQPGIESAYIGEACWNLTGKLVSIQRLIHPICIVHSTEMNSLYWSSGKFCLRLLQH